MSRHITASFAIALALGGCALPKPLTLQAEPYSEATYAAFEKGGSGSIDGTLFAKTVGGDVKIGAGNHVFLHPATDFGKKQSSCWMHDGDCTVTDPDGRHGKHVRITQADAQGRFEFTNLAPGEYVLLSRVAWEIPTQFGLRTTGGNIARTVKVGEGRVTVQLAR